MSKTEVTGKQLKDGSVELVDLAAEVSDVLNAKANTSSLATVATSGSYVDLTNKPTLASFATLTTPTSGQFLKYNGTAWINSAVAYADVTGTPSLATVATSGSYADLTGKPTLFDGAYASLTGKPSLATVATSGSYVDLTNKPTIPTDLDSLTDVVITTASADQFIKHNGTAWVNGSLPVASASISGVVSTSTQTFAGQKNFTGMPWVQGSGPYIAFEETAGGYRGFGVSTYQNVMMISRTAANSRTFQNKNGQWGFAHNLETYKTGINNISPVSQFHVSVADATYKGLIVQGADSQTANLLELQNSAGTALWSIDSAGSLASGTVPVARVSGLATVATSGSYVDLTNKPTLASFATLTTPTSGQFLKYNGTAWINSAVAYADVTGTPSLATVATSGSYADLTGKPTLFDGAYASLTGKPSLATVATSGSYADLSNKPTLASFATLTTPTSGQFLKYNGTAWINSAVAYADVTGTPSLATVATSGSYADLTGKPTLFDGAYASLTGKPSLATVATSGSYADLTNKPAAGASDLDGLSDVVITSAAKGHFIAHNGTNFVNTRTIEADAAATKPLIVKGAAAQTASLFEIQNSSSQILNKIGPDGSVSMYDTAGANGYTLSNVAGTTKIQLAAGKKLDVASTGLYGYASSFNIADEGATNAFSKGKWTLRTTSNSTAGMNIVPNYSDANFFGGVGILVPNNRYIGARFHIFNISDAANRGDSDPVDNYSAQGKTSLLIHGYNNHTANHIEIQDQNNNVMFAINGQGQVQAATAASKALVVKGAASQTANLFETQNSSGTALTYINPNGTLHAKRYTETVANAFNTSLAPSSGTLTVDTSTGNTVLGALSAAVTTWAFTNVPTDNSKVTTVTAVLAGNASYTYGDACSVNGSAVSGGIMWSGGSAPTATAGTDIITFIIVKDSAGTVKVFGSATTNFS